MADGILETLEFAALKELRGVDCSTSRCYANAYGTGRVHRRELLGRRYWTLEFYCPDCKSEMNIGARTIDGLMANVLREPIERQPAVMAAWCATRTSSHPWNDP